MEIGAIIELISTVGFPIACVVALGLFVFKLQAESVARENKLMEMIQTFGEKLQDITSTLERLCGDVDELKHRE